MSTEDNRRATLDGPAPGPSENAYNSLQRRYFQGSISRTIVPRESRQLQRHIDEALQVANLSPGERVLEVGCGMGRYTLQLAQRGVHVEGLDFSAPLLERFRAYNQGRFEIPLYCADALDPPADLEGVFDVVVGFMVLHHLRDVGDVFGALCRVLKPGGRLVLLEANAYNPLFYLQIALSPGMSWEGDGGIARMRAGPIMRAMHRARLRRITVKRFGFFPACIADRVWAARLELAVERVSLWSALLPFQLFKAEYCGY